MRTITAHARILSDDDQPVVGVVLNLEAFVLKSNRWIRVGRAKTIDKGQWSLTVNRNAPREMHAPMLRLVEAGTPAPRVLAQHCYLKYDATRQLVTADFGVVVRLAKEAYKLTPATPQFNRNKYFIAAHADQPQEVMMRMAARMNIFPGGGTGAVRLPNADNQATLKEVELKAMLGEKEQLLSSQTLELKQARTQINNISNNLQQRIKEIERLRKQQEKLQQRNEGKATPLSTIATNIGTEIDSANKTLKNRNLPYQFGKIDFNIKGAVAEDGQSITLARPSDSATAKIFSNVNLELLPVLPPVNLADAVTVPDIVGLTESVVRRLLNSIGLKLEVVSKSMGQKSKVPVGQSIQQSPKSGATAARNDTVLVVFAAP